MTTNPKCIIKNIFKNKSTDVIFIVQNVQIFNNETILFGKLLKGALYEKSELYLINNVNNNKVLFIKEIKNSTNENISRAFKNANIFIVLNSPKDVTIKPFDVLSSYKELEDFSLIHPPTNIKITALLELWKSSSNIILMNAIINEIIYNTYFIYPFISRNVPDVNKKGVTDFKNFNGLLSQIIITIEDFNFLQIYTNLLEYSKCYKYPNQQIVFIHSKDFFNICMQYPNTDGFIINPATHSFVLNLAIIEELERLKQTNFYKFRI